MTYVLIIMSAFAIVGFASREECITARDEVVKQFGRNLDAGAICVLKPKDGEVVGRGWHSRNENDPD